MKSSGQVKDLVMQPTLEELQRSTVQLHVPLVLFVRRRRWTLSLHIKNLQLLIVSRSCFLVVFGDNLV